MPVRIPTNQVVNLQQIEAVVAGPDGANRLFAVTGQLDVGLNAFTPSGTQTQTFSVLIGPVLTRQQFFRAICTASLAKTSFVCDKRLRTAQYSDGAAYPHSDFVASFYLSLKGLQ